MKTLQLNPKNSSTRSVILLILLLSVTTIFSQHKNDSKQYLPQISFNAANGLGPYIIGTKQENVFNVFDLPEKTSLVRFVFIDVDSVRIGNAHDVTGTNLTLASWLVELDTLNLPLSPRLGIVLEYKNDSTAVYNIAYTVYPDTVKFRATEGWGPFITNNYPLTDTSWQPVPELENSFTVNNLPPRTDSLKLEILTADSTVIDSLYVYAPQGQHLDSAVWSNIRMDSLPLSTRNLTTVIWCNGGPRKGLSFHKDLMIIPQNPKLVCKSEGETLFDSIGPFIQNQIAGSALLVDSMKYAIINNGPGSHTLNMGQFTGPYSLNLIEGSFTIEAWLKLDIDMLYNNQGENNMYFMMVDSVWAISVYSYWEKICFEIYSLPGDVVGQYFLYGFNVSFDHFNNSDWHHIAFTFNGQHNPLEYAFYLDGAYVGCVFNQNNYNYVKNNTNYDDFLLTKPLLLGGCNSYLVPNPQDYSFITAMDDIRIWNRYMSGEEIANNYKKSILQSPSLVGCWNFDDRRNRLGTISDISYNNNSGRLKKGATFIPQHPQIQMTMDALIVTSSNALTDSIVFSFIDVNNQIIDSDTLLTNNGGDTLIYDISSLPYEISHLRISEYYPGVPDTGFVTNYHLNGWAPSPIATPYYNWNTYYHTPESFGSLYNPITVSNFPEKTEKVILGLSDNNTISDTVTYTESTIPYKYSLMLNGTDNYIETSQKVVAPSNFTLSLWFKTSTKKGGKIIGFTDTQNGISSGNYDRGLYMMPDGSLRFRIHLSYHFYYLYASSKYNDGVWHNIIIKSNPDQGGVNLVVDGCELGFLASTILWDYEGYWIIGRSNVLDPENDSISEYFKGSLCEIKIEDGSKGANHTDNKNHLTRKMGNGGLHYKLDEGAGTMVNDSLGYNNGEIKGSQPDWSLSNKLSFVRWINIMSKKQPGEYTFFARVFYPGAPDTGLIYPLGKYQIKDPFPGEIFYYNLYGGLGYFNEGTYNEIGLHYYCGYTYEGQYDWKDNFFYLSLVSPDNMVIHDSMITYTANHDMGWIIFDVGEAPPGSYLHYLFGYHINYNNQAEIKHSFSMPIYIKPMIPPIISGDFGPFDQAIAPGVMKRENTFDITTEVLSDLKKIKGVFYNDRNEEIDTAYAIKLSDTNWHLTYNMATLSPPVTMLKFEYYLGEDEVLALVQGPFKITIHKTRPVWFDFLPDSDFHDVVQNSDTTVTFSLNTPFEETFLVNKCQKYEVPNVIPIFGGTSSEMDSPWAQVKLKYNIPDYKLKLDPSQAPKFYQNVTQIAAGSPTYMRAGFNHSQNNSYSLDPSNNLIASQNFSIGGSITMEILAIEGIVKKVERLLNAAGGAEPESIIVKSSFSLSVTGAYEYASRLHLMVDTVSGGWGSFGNLNIDADPAHTQAYKNSASYHFNSASVGMEFSAGATTLEGVAAAYFGLNGRIVMGFGHAYKTIPYNKSRELKSGAFQVYGRVYITILWGWYEKTVWGPKMFYSYTFWGDDMTHCFPPMKKTGANNEFIAANSSWPELGNEIIPVSSFAKIPLPDPQQSVVSSDEYNLLFWLERGENYGVRSLKTTYLQNDTTQFSKKMNIETNDHAINSPTSSALNKNTAMFSWGQTKFTNNTIMGVDPSNVLSEFVKEQDIWLAIYDLERDSVLKMEMIADDSIAGRAEANPEVTFISDNRALIAWQVVDIDIHKSDIWYVLLEKQGGAWNVSTPMILTEMSGTQTDLEIASPEEDMAVLIWMNIDNEDHAQKQIMTSVFSEDTWGDPAELYNVKEDHYINYFDMDFNNGKGALIWTSFVEDTAFQHYETLSMLSWDYDANYWSIEPPNEMMVDSAKHMQLPKIVIEEDGSATIAVKLEVLAPKTGNKRISQIDLLNGNINDPVHLWNHIPANQYVCDTTKQVAGQCISYIGEDTLMILSHEYVMAATNAPFEPVNGIIFSDPYMNMVLRIFKIDEDGSVEDIDENNYFVGIEEEYDLSSKVKLYQNYPNPCIDQTTIQFYIPENTRVKLDLYDMNGHLVATLTDQTLQAGIYEINLNTALLKPGNYIYKLTTDDAVRTLKMIVGM